MLLIQYCLGISVNLYSRLPATDLTSPSLAASSAAVGNGPVLLTRHALLGTLLLITAASALIRSVRLEAPPLIGLTAIALAAIIIAWRSGSEFVAHMQSGASLAMALVAALTILCYALVIFLLGISRQPRPDEGERSDAA
jgi:hypothetical protein